MLAVTHAQVSGEFTDALLHGGARVHGAALRTDQYLGLAGYYPPHRNTRDSLGGVRIVAEAGGNVAAVDLPVMLAHCAPTLTAAPLPFKPLGDIVPAGGPAC